MHIHSCTDNRTHAGGVQWSDSVPDPETVRISHIPADLTAVEAVVAALYAADQDPNCATVVSTDRSPLRPAFSTAFFTTVRSADSEADETTLGTTYR